MTGYALGYHKQLVSATARRTNPIITKLNQEMRRRFPTSGETVPAMARPMDARCRNAGLYRQWRVPAAPAMAAPRARCASRRAKHGWPDALA